LDVTRVADHAPQWEKIALKLRTGEMPPPGRPRPDATTSRAVAAALERPLDAAAELIQLVRAPAKRLIAGSYDPVSQVAPALSAGQTCDNRPDGRCRRAPEPHAGARVLVPDRA